MTTMHHCSETVETVVSAIRRLVRRGVGWRVGRRRRRFDVGPLSGDSKPAGIADADDGVLRLFRLISAVRRSSPQLAARRRSPPQQPKKGQARGIIARRSAARKMTSILLISHRFFCF